MEYNRTSAVFATFSLCLYANTREEKLLGEIEIL